MAYSCGLVLQGGGTRSAFTAGALDVLMDAKIAFPYLIGTSAGALCAVNVVSGDIGRSKGVAVDLMRDRHFISLNNLLFKGSIFDFNYLFNVVPNTLLPFHREAYEKSPIAYTVATTDCLTGKARYFKKGECDDMWDAIAASSSLPLLTKKPVLVDGHPCLDGGAAANVPFQKALVDGCQKIVVILTRDITFRREPPAKKRIQQARRMYGAYPNYVKAYAKQAEVYNQADEQLRRLEKEGRAFVIRPSSPIEIGHTERNKKKLLALYNRGVSDMKERLSALKSFLSPLD